MDELERLTECFRDGRRRRGAGRADAQWVDGPFDDWLRMLEHEGVPHDGCDGHDRHDGCDGCADGGDGEDDRLCHGLPPLERRSVAAFAVGMNEVLPIRDALLLSLIAGRACDKSAMVEFASDPLSVRSRNRMCEILSGAFEDRERGPDRARCVTGIGMLLRIVRMVPEPLSVQPLAAIAYVLWWMGDERATVYALKCLSVDDGCTLAGIVLSMVERGVRPAWCR